MTSGSELRFHRGRDSSPIYQNVWEHHHRISGGGGSGVKTSSVAARFVSPHRTCANRRSSATDANGGSGGRDGNYPHHRNKSSSAGASVNPSSRHSMDVGVACRDALFQVAAESSAAYHHHGSGGGGGGGGGHRQAPPPDDSIIMSRIKESLKQKEEFLRRPLPGQLPAPAQPHPPTKEFYSRPQKLMPPVWPPPAPPPSSSVPPQQQSSSSEQSCAAAAADPSPEPSSSSKPKSKQFVNTLGKIHEDCVKSVAAVPDSADPHLKQANLQMVSTRARQFESGRMDDKTDFYKSELARLSSKHNVPNVAVRKMEYEQKLTYSDKKQPTVVVAVVAPQPQQAVKDDSITSFSSSEYNIVERFE